jgi:hypothetical protein
LAGRGVWDWEEKTALFRAGQLDPEEALVLAHAEWYAELEIEGLPSSVRGPRTFGPVLRDAQCQAESVWGYPCPFPAGRCQIDHLFPYSLGGPTVPENAVWLCGFHNGTKGAEFHMLDLARVSARWLPDIVARIERVRGDARRLGTIR